MTNKNRQTAGGRITLRAIGVYVAMLVATLIAFLAIRAWGQTLTPSVSATAQASESRAAATGQAPGSSPHNVLAHVLLTLACVILLGQLLGRLFVLIHQPPVVGEVVAGILLGPSIWGTDLSSRLLPPEAAPFLGIVAQVGVILYMFLVGLELNAEHLKDRAPETMATSHASIVAPFLLGLVLALLLYPRLATAGVSFTSFSLFIGVAMSITAFPVLARILTDRGLSQTPLGTVALGCAAIDDVTAWCLLAVVTGVARSQWTEGLWVAIGAVIYVALVLVVMRPAIKHWANRPNGDVLGRRTTAAVFIAMLLSCLTTEWIGIHAIFGAFLFGAVIPHDSAVARSFRRELSNVVTILFLPAFFALTGMRTRIDLVTGLDQWLLCGLIIVVATVGKFGGTYVAGRLTGLGWRDAAALGTLMNTRGLMELIVLNVGLDLGVISPTLFSMMVIMAVATTLATAPVLRWLTVPKSSPGLE